MIKLVVLALVFSSGLSYGEEVLRLADSFTSFKQGALMPAGLFHFLSDNQNCEIEGTVMIKPEEGFHRASDSISFGVNPDSSFGSKSIPFIMWNFHPYAGELEKSHRAFISGEELAKKGFYQSETDGEIVGFQYSYKVATDSLEGVDSAEIGIRLVDTVDGTEDVNGLWQGAFSSGNFTEGRVEIKTAQEAYQALSQGKSLYLMEPLGGGGGGSRLRVAGVLLSSDQDYYLESGEAMKAEMIKEPIQESAKYVSVRYGSSVALPAIRCSQH